MCSILASNGQATCQAKKSSREPVCPADSPTCFRCSCAGLATSHGWKTYACPKQSSSASSKKESAIMMLKKERKKKHYKDQLKRRLAQAGINHQSWQQESPDLDNQRSLARKASRKFKAQRQPQRKEAGGRKSEQHPNHPQLKPSFVQRAVGSVYHASDSTAISEHETTDHQPSPNRRLRGISHHRHKM